MDKQFVTITEISTSTASIISQGLLTGSSNCHYPSHGAMHPRTLCNLADEFWMVAGKDSQILYFIPLKSSPTTQVRKVICPGRITAAALSKCNNYAFIGIDEKTYIWDLTSGDLLAILDGPFQPVSVIVTDDKYVLIGSEDGSVSSWPIHPIVSRPGSNLNNLNHIWRKHTSAVTGLVLGTNSLAVSCSLDATCHFYNLEEQAVILSLFFHQSVHSIAMDTRMYRMFTGLASGEICLSKLYEESQCKLLTNTTDSLTNYVYTGHTDKVIVLCVSIDDKILASGSSDNSFRVWNISSRQCLRTLNYKGSVLLDFCM